MRLPRLPRPFVLALVVLLLMPVAAACSSGSDRGGAARLTLYTSVTQNTVDAVVAGFKAAHPGVTVDVFRATTGQLNARIEADRRSGGLRADVIWGTDPLSMQSLAEQDLLATWPVPDVSGVDPRYRTDYFWGSRVLYVIMVVHQGFA